MSNHNHQNSQKDSHNHNPNVPKDMKIYCPECGMKVPDDLIRVILDGEDIFCEQCGFHFTGISSRGEVKPLSKKFKKDKQEDSKSLTKREGEWITWKEEWDKIKSRWKKSMKEWKKRWKQELTEFKYHSPKTHPPPHSKRAYTAG